MAVIPDAVVVGAGVSGLTTALCIARAGGVVRLVSDRAPLATTSVVAGAVWGPHGVDDPRVLRWCVYTLDRLEQLAETHPQSGVRIASGMEAAHETTSPPTWIVDLADYAPVPDCEVPSGYAAAWRYRVPVVEMPTYLGFLADELAALGVRVEIRPPVQSLGELAGQGRAIVNCTGLGAREVVPDASVYPAQGQLVVVDNPGVQGFFVDDPDPVSGDPTYFIPHRDHVVLGGSFVPRSDRTNPDPDVGKAIVTRCAAIEPALATARVREYRVGLRPARRGVRLERVEESSGTVVVHNYGHGGAGLTLSWGCAMDACELVLA